MEFSFDMDEAIEFGLEAAVIIRHFRYWIMRHKEEGRHAFDGRTWSYDSYTGLARFFGFWSDQQVRRILTKLVKEGVLLKRNYHQHGSGKGRNPKISWYAFTNEERFLVGRNRQSKVTDDLDRQLKSTVESDRSSVEINRRVSRNQPTTLLTKDTDKTTNRDIQDKGTSCEEFVSGFPGKQAYQLLRRHKISQRIALRLASEHELPQIEQVIKNGIAKQFHSDPTGKNPSFTLQPGWIIKALENAKREGKTIAPTVECRDLEDKLQRRKNYQPAGPEEIEHRKEALRKQAQSLGTVTGQSEER